jgi:dTDP-4-dehydrorhamnose reductase
MKFFFSKPKILVYGANGWIGSLFIKLLESKGIRYFKGHSRIECEAEVIYEINEIKPTHIIAFTGRTHGTLDDGTKINTIDYLEYPGKLKENVRDNLFAPLILSSVCLQKGIHYTYIGTGCIFNGPEEYTEDSKPDFFGSSYSVVKGFTDQLIKRFPVLNIRIRMPISSVSDTRNFINKITSYSKICSISNSMTVLDDFLPIILDLMVHRKTGTYNCTNPGTISHDSILEMYREIVDPEFKWENMTLEEQRLVIKSERSNNKLDTTKISSRYRVPDINTSVKNVLKLFKN